MQILRQPQDQLELTLFKEKAGSKAAQLAKLSLMNLPVPPFFCISHEALSEFIATHQLESYLNHDLSVIGDVSENEIEEKFLALPFPKKLEDSIKNQLKQIGLLDSALAIRSSGFEEDSSDYSFAGQFSSFLNQKGMASIAQSILRCWAARFSPKIVRYKKINKINKNIFQMGVIIQKMVEADSAGVAFSRNPNHPLDRDHLIINSVWGLGEGLVNGELNADSFKVHRKTYITESKIVPKQSAYFRHHEGGVAPQFIESYKSNQPSLNVKQIRKITEVVLLLESIYQSPQDCEWAFEGEQFFLLQTRPITNLPMDLFFDSRLNGRGLALWDNSNIIESYGGVTSPLTFSFAADAYRQVYQQFCEVVGIPKKIIDSNDRMFRNMLGLVRGRIYYNLISWYRLVLMLPGSSNNREFMETMMGVKQKVKSDSLNDFEQLDNLPKYSFLVKTIMTSRILFRFFYLDTLILRFKKYFNSIYLEHSNLKFKTLSLQELVRTYKDLEERLLKRWHAPIINDYLCMIFFGLLKKLTEKWTPHHQSLHNDLLCGEGNIESTEPTRMLMRIAEKIDRGPLELKLWFTQTESSLIWEKLKSTPPGFPDSSTAPSMTSGPINPDDKCCQEISDLFLEFLTQYGFRCVNELKLEAPDLHENPTFAIQAIQSYLKRSDYSFQKIEDREQKVRLEAEAIAKQSLPWVNALIYFWVLKHTRKLVRNRENLRFARTRIFGVVRHLFLGIGAALVELNLIREKSDIFYLTVDEIISFIEGRAVSLQLKSLIELRKYETDEFRRSAAPPDQLVTRGAAGLSFRYPLVLFDSTLSEKFMEEPDPSQIDPNLLFGVPCCPGIVEGVVRVIETMEDARGIDGEILVTPRTDAGWVPLFPSCSGLLIERGSLLSHSAVIARELGLPTIVGISGGLLHRLKSGQKIRMDACKGEVRILE